MSYVKFAAMILASTAMMYGLMFLNAYEIDHVYYSQTRMWMAVIMGCAMAIVMLLFMWRMYENRSMNIGIVVACLLGAGGALWLVRSQETVGDVAYMKAMIPHHSIAIMTSRRAKLGDSRVRRLAEGIVEAQVREIAEMKKLIAMQDNAFAGESSLATAQ